MNSPFENKLRDQAKGHLHVDRGELFLCVASGLYSLGRFRPRGFAAEANCF